MSFRKILILFGLALAVPGPLSAIQITGKVTAISGDVATIAMDGSVLPSIGNKVDIYFNLGNDEVLVGSGNITEATSTSIKARIDNSTGTVAKDQLARVDLDPGPQATEKTVPTNASGPNPLPGDWTGPAPGDAKVSFSFKEDNTLLWVVEDANSATSTFAKYRVDTSVTPNVVELFDFSEGDFKGLTLRGFFELQSDGRLKLDLSEKQERGFSDRETVLMSRATAPIVRPSPLASPPPKANTKPPDGGSAANYSEERIRADLIARYERGDDTGAIEGWNKIITSNPKDSKAFFWRGSSLSRKGDKKAALADFETAMTLDPSFNLDAVIAKIKGAPTSDTKSPDDQKMSLGGKLFDSKDFDGAIKAYTEAININPKNASAYEYRGFAFDGKDDYDSAIADYKKAIALDPSRKETVEPWIERAKHSKGVRNH